MRFLYLIVFLSGHVIHAQDTTFVRSLPLDSAVINIDSDGELLYLRFKNSLYSWSNNELNFIQEGKFKYSWVNYDSKRDVKVINHNEVIEQPRIEEAQQLINLLPGEYNYTTTTSTVGNYLYVCHNGIVLEYKITAGFTRIHKGNSIRHIYSEPGLRVISTYNGVLVDTVFDTFSSYKMHESLTNYSNGEFVKIDSVYYLCQDNLLTFNRESGEVETFINTEGTPRFRRLLKFNEKTFALYNNAFGEINLETGAREYVINDELSDFIEYNQKLYISSLNSTLYEMNRNGEIQSYQMKSAINDLSVVEDQLLIGTNSGLFAMNDTIITEVIPGVEIIQLLSFNDKLIFSNNNGLHFYSNDIITPLVENIEFNRMALYQDEHFLYAGSVYGLYVIDNNQLRGIIQNQPSVLYDDNPSQLLIVIFSALIIAVIIILIVVRKNRLNQPDIRLTKKSLDSGMIRNILITNPKILSVGQLAEYLNTSVVQLNRNLKKEKLTALTLLRSVMKEIAVEMYQNGSSLDEISKRVGYSKRYVRSKFLKERDQVT